VPENIAHHLDIGSRINLTACVTVSKRMRADHFGWNARKPGVLPDTVPDGNW